MKNLLKGLLLSVAMLVLTGCGVTGDWTLHTITPEEARQHYELASVTLNDDGTYTANATRAGREVTSTGTYTFENGKLSFSSDAGKTRTYDARLILCGCKMVVKTTVEGEEVKAIMKRK